MKLTPFIVILASGASLLAWCQSTPETVGLDKAPDNPGTKPGTEVQYQPSKQGGSGGLNSGGGQDLRPVNTLGIYENTRLDSGHSETGPVSVIWFGQPDPAALAETTEDLTVLSFLLSRKLERSFAHESSDYKLGIPMLLTSAGHSVDTSYIQGFGVIFSIQVRFPLVAPAHEGEKSLAGSKVSEWEQAKLALKARTAPGNLYPQPSYPQPGWMRGNPYNPYPGNQADQSYDSRLVETLRRRVIVLLGNASNLRHFDANEWVVVKITGAANAISSGATLDGANSSPNQPLEPEATLSETPGATSDAKPGLQPKLPPGGGRFAKSILPNNILPNNVRDSGRPTVMTLRVKKAAADAFAAGTMSEEQFLKAAEVVTYLDPASDASAIVEAAIR
jgi:hypothetical protein